MQKKNICVITGSRAEYGLLRNLCIAIKKDSKLNLQIIVTGAS
jgi:UDP-N-acetylglucosamine 2-epimerase